MPIPISRNKKFDNNISNAIVAAVGMPKKFGTNSKLVVVLGKKYLFNENNKDLIAYLMENKLLEGMIVSSEKRMREICNYYTNVPLKPIHNIARIFCQYEERI